MRNLAFIALFLCFLTGGALAQGTPLTVFVVPSCGTGTSGYTPTQNRLATMDTTGRLCVSGDGGGGGGGSSVTTLLITSGTINVSSATTVAYLWASATAGTKTETVYPCTPAVNGNIMIIKDAMGNAATYAIILAPAGGTIDGLSSYPMNINYMNINLLCVGNTGNWVIE